MNEKLIKLLFRTLIITRYFLILACVLIGLYIVTSILGILGIPTSFQKTVTYTLEDSGERKS
jgi:hypothetical protein